MDLILSPRPQTLISIISLPSSSHFRLSSSIRREFFGCGNHSRLHGSRSRRRCRKLRFPRYSSPQCLSQDFPDPVLVVSVAFVAFTALQVIYLYLSRRRREAAELSEVENVGAPLSYEILRSGKHIVKTKVVNTFDSEAGYIMKEPSLRIPSIQTDAGLAGIPLTKEFGGLSVMPDGLGVIEQENCLFHIPEFQQGRQQEDMAVSENPFMKMGNKPGGNITLENGDRGSNADSRLKPTSAVVNNNRPHMRLTSDFTASSARKQPDVSMFKDFSMEFSKFTLQDGNVSHSQLRSSQKRADVLVKASISSADYSDAPVPVACTKEVPMNKEKHVTGTCGFTKDTGKILTDKSHNKKPGFPHSNGSLVKDALDLPAYLRAYTSLLRESRLRDCLDLLESVDRKSLLDMDKINPVKFLNVCKKQKALKEAFRFVKLIEKPTLSTFNMLLSVCASSQDFEGAFQVMLLVKEAGLKPDCKLYTTLISTCAKCGKVDAMFEVFHEMVNAGVEPNVNTYGALIDGCARAGQVPKAFGAYGIMRSKKVQPDRVVFNALITACGQSGAVDRAFDVLAEMRAEPKPIDPDHVTVGALMRTCIQAGQVERAHEVYKMLHEYNIKGTPVVYTIAVSSCSQTGDLDFALSVYDDMKKKGVMPDEMFFSTLIDVAGHAGKVEAAFEILQDAKSKGVRIGIMSYSSLMGACCNGKNWQKALELYEDIKAVQLLPTVSTLNALLTSLCDGGQLLKSIEVLDELRDAGVQPNEITYSILIVACEKKDEAELGFMLLSKAKEDRILPNLIICRCLTGLCLRSFKKAYSIGEPVISFDGGRPHIDNKWASHAIMAYRETIAAGVIPTIEVFSQVLGCLQFPRDTAAKERFFQNLGVSIDAPRSSLYSLLDGFGEYDTRSFSVLEEATSLGVIPRASFKDGPIVVDARKFQIHIVEVQSYQISSSYYQQRKQELRLPMKREQSTLLGGLVRLFVPY
ncbi:Tetratricopeptide-like helical domain-containing protein [Dioscorea alata]|uniref:Tetratricopeptide-like helical domain-containing protein n=2 Tax=Dioscorea alata TaxID=55571 RepID=A0ACB7WH37_DIOAL|nr:Tetratricopeptide-like helical domain-containing protein [Dioscorea alata]